MRVPARILAALLVLAGALATPLLARSVAAGEIPPASACYRVHKLGLMEMFDLIDDLDEQADRGGYGVTSVYGPSLASGSQATVTEMAAVEQTLNAFIACINERDVRRLVSLLSERYQAELILDFLDEGSATSAIEHQFPIIFKADDVEDPIQTPDIERAWHPTTQPEQIWAVVSGPVPGYVNDVQMFLIFTPGESRWTIDLIAGYSE